MESPEISKEPKYRGGYIRPILTTMAIAFLFHSPAGKKMVHTKLPAGAKYTVIVTENTDTQLADTLELSENTSYIIEGAPKDSGTKQLENIQGLQIQKTDGPNSKPISVSSSKGKVSVTPVVEIHQILPPDQLEKVFKSGVLEMLKSLHSIDSLPKNGKKIEYYRPGTSQKLMPIDVKNHGLPVIFNVHPRGKLKKPISGMVFQMDDRYFLIKPWVGKVKGVGITTDSLDIPTTITTLHYSKEKITDIIKKLLESGDDCFLLGSSVKELTKKEFEEWEENIKKELHKKETPK